MGGEKGLWVVEMRGIWTAGLMFSYSTFPLTQSSNEGPKMHDVVLINTNLLASDLPGYIKAASCVYTCTHVYTRVHRCMCVCLPVSSRMDYVLPLEGMLIVLF